MEVNPKKEHVQSLKMPELRAYAKQLGVAFSNKDTKDSLQAKVMVAVENVEASEVKAEPEGIPVVVTPQPEPAPAVSVVLPSDLTETEKTQVIDNYTGGNGTLLPDTIVPRIKVLQEERGLTYEVDHKTLSVTFRCGPKLACENLKQPPHLILSAAEYVCARIITPEQVGILNHMKGAW